MKAIKNLWKRLKKPHILLGILSEIIIILKAFDVNVDTEALSVGVTAICSIMVLLGIISEPEDNNISLYANVIKCSNCGQTVPHIRIGDFLICQNCGSRDK